MSKIKVSVVIPIYNGELLIRRCLNSVFNQKGKFDLEVIVVDDGSSDNSIKIIKSFKKPLKVLQQKNSGPSAARNKGIECATGNYLAFLDADDFWESNFLNETLNFFKKNTICIAVSVAQNHKIIGKKNKIMPVIINQYIKSNRKAFIIDNFFHYWNKHNHVCTGSILIKTEVIKKIGGFRNDLRITEDLELWILLSTYGLIGFIPKVLFTSDGGIVTKKIGWLKKNIVRWESTPTIDVWQKRIIKRIDKNQQEDFNFVKGRIIKNLTYSLIMAGKYNLSREQISKYKDYLPKDKMSGLMSIISENKYFWFLFAKIIKMREYLK